MNKVGFPLNSLEFSDSFSNSEKFNMFVEEIETIINTDMNKFISLLYRLDVSEEKIRKSLAENNKNQSAGVIFANLIIEREKEKIKWRKLYSNREI